MDREYPINLAARILEQWDTFSQEPGHHPAGRPPQPVLSALLENCFFASLKGEEGRPTQFDLALCSPEHLGNAATRFSQFTKIFNLIRFDQPRDFSAHELVRLAPACNPDKTLLLADYKNEQLKLWGVVDVDWQSGTSIRLNELRIRVSAPGEMKITLHHREFCHYKDGGVIEPERGLINTGPIYDFFKQISLQLCRDVKAATGQPIEDAIHERDYRAMAYLFTLQRTIEEIQLLKHGGCILVVPEGSTAQSFTNLDIKYVCRDQTVWNCLLGKWILHDRFHTANESHCDREELTSLQLQRNDTESGLRDALSALVRFTAVDGAVLMTRKFELLGFGAVVKLRQSDRYQVVRYKDRRATQPQAINIEDYGTRHRSAFEFCYRSGENAVAIVVSQDGGVKIVRRVRDDVCFWENITFDLTNEI